MSSIPELKLSDTGVWYVHWTEGRRSRRVSTRTRSLVAAKAFLGQWLLMERDAPAAVAALTCSEVWALYAAKHLSKRPRSTQITSVPIGNNLMAHFGARPVVSVRQDDFDTYEVARMKGRIGRPSKPATVRHELTMLQASWSWATKSKFLPAGAAPRDLTKPDAAGPRVRWLTEAEIDKVLEAVRQGPRLSRVERFVWLALETAARKTAIVELTWGQVDFDNRVIHFLADGAIQTSKRRASVPISDRLLPVLRRAWAERRDDFVIGRAAAGESADPRVRVMKIAAAAGVPGCTPHVFRHTAATHMVRNGVSLWIVAKILGNSVAQVEATYAKYQPEFGREAVNWRRNIERTVERERPDWASKVTNTDLHGSTTGLKPVQQQS